MVQRPVPDIPGGRRSESSAEHDGRARERQQESVARLRGFAQRGSPKPSTRRLKAGCARTTDRHCARVSVRPSAERITGGGLMAGLPRAHRIEAHPQLAVVRDRQRRAQILMHLIDEPTSRCMAPRKRRRQRARQLLELHRVDPLVVRSSAMSREIVASRSSSSMRRSVPCSAASATSSL